MQKKKRRKKRKGGGRTAILDPVVLGEGTVSRRPQIMGQGKKKEKEKERGPCPPTLWGDPSLSERYTTICL